MCAKLTHNLFVKILAIIVIIIQLLMGCQSNVRRLVIIKGKSANRDSILHEMGNLLQLDNIKNVHDTLAIRVWCELYKRDYLFDLTSNSEGSSCNIYSFGWEAANDSASWLTIYPTKKSVTPKTNWRNFFDQLIQYDVKVLPDMDSLIKKQKEFVDGGDYYTVEIADSNHYRNYHYFSPESYENEYPEVRNFLKIIGLIFAEFGIIPTIPKSSGGP